jgi:hypothetical protein
LSSRDFSFHTISLQIRNLIPAMADSKGDEPQNRFTRMARESDADQCEQEKKSKQQPGKEKSGAS